MEQLDALHLNKHTYCTDLLPDHITKFWQFILNKTKTLFSGPWKDE